MSALEFVRGSRKLQRKMWWQNVKVSYSTINISKSEISAIMSPKVFFYFSISNALTAYNLIL
jgi:hypothetical protein